MAYLKFHLRNGGGLSSGQSGGRMRIKSNAPTQKKLNSLIQGVLTEFAQPNPYPQQPASYLVDQQVMTRQYEAVQQAQMYSIQKRPKIKRSKTKGKRNTQELTGTLGAASSDYSHSGQVYLDGAALFDGPMNGDLEDLGEFEKIDEEATPIKQESQVISRRHPMNDSYEEEVCSDDQQEVIPKDLNELLKLSQSMHENAHGGDRRTSSLLMMEPNSHRHDQRSIGSAHMMQFQSQQQNAMEGQNINAFKKQSTAVSMRKPTRLLNQLQQLNTPLSKMQMIPQLTSVEKSIQHALTAYGKNGAVNQAQTPNNLLPSQTSTSKSKTSNSIMHSPRDAQRQSLILQRVGLKASKLDFQHSDKPQLVEPPSSKQAFHQQSASQLPRSAAMKFPIAQQNQVLMVTDHVGRIAVSPKQHTQKSQTFMRPLQNQRVPQQVLNSKAVVKKQLPALNPSPRPSAQPNDGDVQDDTDSSEASDEINCAIRDPVPSNQEAAALQEDEIGETTQKGCATQRDQSNKDQEETNYFGVPAQAQMTQPPLPQGGIVKPRVIKRDKERERLKELERDKEKELEKEKERVKSGDIILCSVVSVEPYMKRCMQKLGWYLIQTGLGFHIKFDISDKEGTHNKLHPRQWYNHFPNNRELTTKAGLCKNLWHQCFLDYELQVSTFFPRCYDLSDQRNIEQFVTDFQTTAILGIIKQYSNHFRKTTPRLDEYLQEYLNKDSFESNKIYKQNFRLKCSQLDQHLSGAGSLLGNDNLRFAMQYIRQSIIKKYHIDSNQIQRRFTEDEIQMMIELSSALWESGVKNEKFPIYEQVKTLALDRKLSRLMPQYAMIDGVANVWVVKPSFNSRGVGVYCTNKLKEIIVQGKKSASKVVQKYIERPFLLNNKKFDIRQWVLVTSWEPLDIYVFSGAYLKICGNDFNLRNLSDQYSHLSNFSIQKGNKLFGNDELVMSHEQFEGYIRGLGRGEFNWETDMKPKINTVVYSTLKGVQDSMDHRPNTFEIYGFDLILDEDLRPWVIEVNLSPACNERTEWLTKMVDDMCMDLLANLEQKIAAQSEADPDPEFKDRPKRVNQLPHAHSLTLNKEAFYLEHDIKHKWIRLNESLLECKNTKNCEQQYLFAQSLQNQQISQPFQITGIKINNRYERNLDKDYKKLKASKVIQRWYRGYKDRLRFKNILQNRSSLLIQRYLKRRLALNKVKLIISNLASVFIQRYLRRKRAVWSVQLLIAEKIARAKLFVALKVQSFWRRRQALQVYKYLNNNAKAKIIQTYLRKTLAQRLVLQKLSYKAKIVRIQRFFKKCLAFKHRQANLIQKRLRQVRGRKKVKRLLSIKQGSEKLLKVFEKAKVAQMLATMHTVAMAVRVQNRVRQVLAKNKVKQLVIEKHQNRVKALIDKYQVRQLKQCAMAFRDSFHKSVQFIQGHLKTYLATLKVVKLKKEKLLNDKAKVIQCRLRQFLARSEIEQRQIFFYALTKIQGFARMVLAKRKVRIIRQELTKAKKHSRKYSRKQSAKRKVPNKEIENYVENLLQREMDDLKSSHRKLSSKKVSASHTPSHDLTRKSYQELPSVSQSLRGSMQSSTKQEAVVQRNGGFDTTINVSDYGKKEHMSSSVLTQYQAIQHADGNDSAILERLQKSLKVRKTAKTIDSGHAGAEGHQSSKQSYQRELNSKVISAINKAKTGVISQQSQRLVSQPKKSKIQDIQKPKSFAENLMSMLAKQNIGQAFSENPVEALQVLKTKESGSFLNGNRSNIWSDSSIQNPQRRNSQYARQEVTSAGFYPAVSSQQSTIEGSSTKFTSFPKLADFKSATNNIYLQNRPLADPRKEAEYQQDLNESRLKQAKNPQSSNISRADIHCQSDMGQMRKSTEHFKHCDKKGYPLQSISPSIPSGLSALEDNMMMQRPNKDANLMVVQAYKKANIDPVKHFKKPTQKKEHYSKSKRKFMKMVEMDEGILFPLTAGHIKELPQQKRSRAQNTVSTGGFNSVSYESAQHGSHPNTGGATTMPPIFVDTTKIMIV